MTLPDSVTFSKLLLLRLIWQPSLCLSLPRSPLQLQQCSISNSIGYHYSRQEILSPTIATPLATFRVLQQARYSNLPLSQRPLSLNRRRMQS